MPLSKREQGNGEIRQPQAFFFFIRYRIMATTQRPISSRFKKNQGQLEIIGGFSWIEAPKEHKPFRKPVPKP